MVEIAAKATEVKPPETLAAPQRRAGEPRHRRVSPLTLRILAVNVVALAILAVGLLYMDRYEDSLIRAEIEALQVQARLIAGALGEAAVDLVDADTPRLQADIARPLVRRLAAPTRGRARLFGQDGLLIVDSALLLRPTGFIQVLPLPADPPDNPVARVVTRVYDWMFNALPRNDDYKPYPAGLTAFVTDFGEGVRALLGEVAASVYLAGDGHLMFSVAVPVQRYRQVIGVLVLSRSSVEVDDAMRAVRLEIVGIFLGALAVTILLSFYLANAIARPIRRLAAASERVRLGRPVSVIPDFSPRGDEIGDLSVALRAMTDALAQRLEAIERFAADVAHEIKNPLTSLRSAVETASRVSDPAQQTRLLAIVMDDVRRLDRLISDISSASRLDAELARAETAPVDLGRLLQALAEVHAATAGETEAPLALAVDGDLMVAGIEDRLVQVFRNLIANAVSFSPPGGVIRIAGSRQGGQVLLTVEDDGPGIPEGKAAAIFDRFYSERPKAEKFGMHSGLGLSISRQIVEAHGGDIRAENRTGPDGRVLGARFLVTLPAFRGGKG